MLHEHMATLAARATQANLQPYQPQPLDEDVQDAEIEVGNSRNAHRKAYSVEEWRSLLAVRFVSCSHIYLVRAIYIYAVYVHTQYMYTHAC